MKLGRAPTTWRIFIATNYTYTFLPRIALIFTKFSLPRITRIFTNFFFISRKMGVAFTSTTLRQAQDKAQYKHEVGAGADDV